MAESPQDASNEVIQGLVARTLSEAPELREPPPLTQEEIQVYHQLLRAMPYSQLVREKELVTRVYDSLAPALPSWRLQLDQYPHPIVQQRLLMLNEWYLRAAENPRQAYTYGRNRMMIEWGAAGAAIGGLVSYFSKKDAWTGIALGAVLGGVAGRSELFQQLLLSLSTRAVAL